MKCEGCEKRIPLQEGRLIRNGMRLGMIKRWDFYCGNCDPEKEKDMTQEPCLCGAPDCLRCFPDRPEESEQEAYERYRQWEEDEARLEDRFDD